MIAESEYKKLEREVTQLLKALKKDIADEYRCSDDPDDNVPGMCVTVGATPHKDGHLAWGYQTGDNSFTGGAYGHPYWGVGYLYRRSNSAEVAKEMIEEIADQIEEFSTTAANSDMEND